MSKINPQILVINPGSTSTKIAWFKGSRRVWEHEVQHSQAELRKFPDVFSQLEWRCGMVEKECRLRKTDPEKAQAVVGRGGLMKPVQGGVYEVNAAMCRDLRGSKQRWGLEHASDLGAEMARRFAGKGLALVVDPVSTDELSDEARVSGMPGYERRSLLHALNTRAVCHRAAASLKIPLSKTRFVVAHLGGGASISAVAGGRLVDTTGALAGQGPFTATRAGSLPSKIVLDLALRKGMTAARAMQVLLKQSGLQGYLGTAHLPQAQKKADAGDRKASLVLKALSYQVCKDLGSYAAVLGGRIQAVILTGGMAHHRPLVASIRKQIGYLGRVMVYPGQLEMEAMAEGARDVLSGRRKTQVYGSRG